MTSSPSADVEPRGAMKTVWNIHASATSAAAAPPNAGSGFRKRIAMKAHARYGSAEYTRSPSENALGPPDALTSAV